MKNFLANINNSCYMDSVLMIILGNSDNEIFDEIISSNKSLECKENHKNIQKEINNIINFINDDNKSSYNVVKLRKLFKECNERYNFQNNFGKFNQEDSKEFLDFLLKVTSKNFKESVKIKKSSYYIRNMPNATITNNDIKKIATKIEKNSLIVDLKLDDNENGLVDMNKYNFIIDHPFEIELPQNEKDRTQDMLDYTHRVHTSKLLKAKKGIVFQNLSEEKYNITPSEIFTLTNGKTFKLYGIVYFTGTDNHGHYTCVFEKDNVWYYSDDIFDKIENIGNFDYLITYNKLNNKFPYLFFYKNLL